MDEHTVHVVLMYVTWIEFVLGSKITDQLGSDEPLKQGSILENLKKFEEELKTKKIEDIKPEDIWEVYKKKEIENEGGD